MTPVFAFALILVVSFAGVYLIGQWVTWSAQSKAERRLRALRPLSRGRRKR